FAEEDASEPPSHHAPAAETDEQSRTAFGMTAEPLECAVGGQSGAHQRSGKARRQRRVVDQVARMRHHDVIRVAAIDGNAEMVMGGPHVFFTGPPAPPLPP